MLNITLLLKLSILLFSCLLLSIIGIYDILYAVRLRKAKAVLTLQIPSFAKMLLTIGIGVTIVALFFTLWIFFQNI